MSYSICKAPIALCACISFFGCNYTQSVNNLKYYDNIASTIDSEEKDNKIKSELRKIHNELNNFSNNKSLEEGIERVSELSEIFNSSKNHKINNGSATVIANIIQDAGDELLYLDITRDLSYLVGSYGITIQCCRRIQGLGEDLSKKDIAARIICHADTLRKLFDYDGAIKKYEEALSYFNKPEFAVIVYNNLALTYIELAAESDYMFLEVKGKLKDNYYKEANELYEKAIKVESLNPLYRCGYATTLFSLGKIKESIFEFIEVEKLLANEENIKKLISKKKLTERNLSAINAKISSIINCLKEVEKQETPLDDDVRVAIIDYIGQVEQPISMVENENQIEQNVVYRKLIDIRKDSEMNRYYKSFMRAFNISHTTAEGIMGDAFSLDTNSLLLSGTCKLISLIPIIGDVVSGVVEKGAGIINEITIKRNSNNILAFAEDKVALRKTLIRFLTRSLQDDKRIKDLDPNAIMPEWAVIGGSVGRFISDKKEDFEAAIYGDKNTERIQKLAHKHATLLLSDYIANSKIYEDYIKNNPDKVAADMTRKEKVNALYAFFEKSLLSLGSKQEGNKTEVEKSVHPENEVEQSGSDSSCALI
jgi:tetratricopeptide (TPR) repeat protein